MKQLLIILSIFLFSFTSQAQKASLNTFVNHANTFFGKHVKDGLVDYKGIKQNPKELNNMLGELKHIKLEDLSKSEKLALYVNAYNLFVIKNLVNYMPIKSPLDQKGFFKNDRFFISNKSYTLDELENKIIRPTYNDARIHFVLVCGAKGCPPLTSKAYYPETIDKQLDKQTKLALDDPNYTQVENSSIKLTQIFNWYKVDFGNSDQGIINFINEYKSKPVKTSSSIEYYTYNWEINIQ